MKVVRTVEFTKEEVSKATNEALCKVAASAIGEPSDDECWDVDVSSWRDSATAKIVKKADAEKPQEGTEA